MNVCLSQSEGAQLPEAAQNIQQHLAFSLGARCGLRRHEVPDVSPEDVVDTDTGTVLRVCHGKSDQFRETPVPRDLITTIRTVADIRDAPASTPLLEISTTRSLRRKLAPAEEQLADETDDDDGWRYLGFHDLRRTWATVLAATDLDH